MSDSDQYYSTLPGGSAYQPTTRPTEQPTDRPGPRPTGQRQQFRSRGQVVAGAVCGLILGLVLLVIGPKEIALALQIEGTPGTLTVSSCIKQRDGKSYDYACTGDFHATKGGLNLHGVSYSSVNDLTGRTITVQRGPDGGYYSVSPNSAAMWAGFTAFGLCLVGIFLMFLPSFSRRIDYRVRPSEQIRADMLGPVQRRTVRFGARMAVVALLVFLLCEVVAVCLAVL